MKTIPSSTSVQYYSPTLQPKNRLLHRIRRILVGLVIILIVLTGGAAYQAIATRSDQRSFPPPGQLYDVGGYRLHIYCTGPQNSGNPTVILEALSGGSSIYWGWVQPEIAKITRVCSYDRAGFGWSDPAPRPPSFQRTVSDLHKLLVKANIPGPYILVGHSKGGLIVRGFAAEYPDETAGLVLLDASQPDLFSRHPETLAENEAFLRQSALFPWLARIGMFHIYFAAGGEIDFKDLPAREHDELAAFWSSPGYWEMQRADMIAGADFFGQAQKLGRLGDLPLAVVSAGTNLDPGMQAELAALSNNSIHITVEGASHVSLVFDPQNAQSTSAAILQLVQAVRMGQPLANR